MPWLVYILRCSDTTLYTGITTNIETRLNKHADGTGAKYTRGRAPHMLLYTEPHDTKSDALKRELEIKALSRDKKLKLAATRPK